MRVRAARSWRRRGGSTRAIRGGCSGAEIEQAIISGLYDAFDQQHDLDQPTLENAVASTRPLSVLKREEIDRRRKWADGRPRPAS